MSRIASAFVAAALGLSLLSAPSSLPETGPVADYTAAAVATAYGDPHWYPLRNDAELRCVFSQCIGTPEYPALDLAAVTDTKGDPVHAAGKGIFHVGDTGESCFGGDQVSTRGNWGWVDHGGGIVSRYHHLDTIKASEWQVVDPTTVIGTMGQTGSKCGSTFYLHFETRRGGVNGTPYPRYPGLLRICTPARTFYPTDLGYNTWNSIPRDTVIPGGTAGCYTDPVTPVAPPSTSTQRGSTWARLRWANPASRITGAAVHRQEYQVGAGKWGLDTYRYYGPAARETVYKDVRSLRKYRARVSYRNAFGHSRWTPWRELVGPPRVPAFRELSSTSSKVIFRWYKPLHNGAEVTGYIAGISQKTPSGWGPWSFRHIPDGSTSTSWTNLRSGRTYAVKVRAKSGAGPSAFSTVRTIATR